MDRTYTLFQNGAERCRSFEKFDAEQAEKQVRDGLESLKAGNFTEAVDLLQLAIQNIGHARENEARAQTYEDMAEYLSSRAEA